MGTADIRILLYLTHFTGLWKWHSPVAHGNFNTRMQKPY